MKDTLSIYLGTGQNADIKMNLKTVMKGRIFQARLKFRNWNKTSESQRV